MKTRLIWLLVVCGCLSSSAAAQTPRAAGPFAGLFGGGQTPATNTHSLGFSGSLFEVYQEALIPPDAEARVLELDPRFQRTATLGGAAGSLAYAYNRNTSRSNFTVNGNGSLSDFSVSPDLPVATFTAASSVSTNLTRKIVFSASGATSYSPFISFSPLPDQSARDTSLGPSELAFAWGSYRTLPVGASVNLVDNLTKRTSIAVNSSWQHLYFLDLPQNNFSSWSSSLLVNHRPFRRVSVHAGYVRTLTRYADETEPAESGGWDVGLSYGDDKSIKLTRRTSLSVGTGLSAARSSGGNSSSYALTGHATLTYDIGRTWSASAAYVRSFGFVALFREPVLSDSVIGTIGGLIHPRVNWSSSAGWTRSRIGSGQGSVTAYNATSSLGYGITPHLGAFAQYVYYNYRLPEALTSLSVLPVFARQSVSVGLGVSLPIFNRTGGRVDTR